MKSLQYHAVLPMLLCFYEKLLGIDIEQRIALHLTYQHGLI